MTNWSKEIPDMTVSKVCNITTNISTDFQNYINEKYKNNEAYTEWLNMLIGYFKYILEDILYITIKNYKEKNFKDIFNRPSALHYLENINLKSDESRLGTIRLFLVIDVIAEIYFRSNYEKYKKLWEVSNLNFNDNLLKAYWQFYIYSSYKALYDSEINTINNVFMKENITNEEIKKSKDFYEVQNDKFLYFENYKKNRIKWFLLKNNTKYIYRKSKIEIEKQLNEKYITLEQQKILNKLMNLLWKKEWIKLNKKFVH